MGVLPLVEGQGGQVRPEEQAIGLVLHVDANFLFHHVALVVQVLLGEIQVAHAVGFQPEDGLEGGNRRLGYVIGVVIAGGTVEGATAALDNLHETAFGSLGCALEHHVLEQVGEASASPGLQAKTHVIHDGQAKSGRAVVFRYHQGQAIFQLVRGYGQGVRCSCRGQAQQQKGRNACEKSVHVVPCLLMVPPAGQMEEGACGSILDCANIGAPARVDTDSSISDCRGVSEEKSRQIVIAYLFTEFIDNYYLTI